MDEFEQIARLFRPLTFGAPEALDLADDAAVIASRPGFDLVITKDALVAGVHFLADDPADLVARKLLRVNLSDLAAKGAEPFGYLLAVAWPSGFPDAGRVAFAAGLEQDQRRFGLKLLGGDTVSTPGPMTLSVTMLGWAPTSAMVRRSTARVGDALLVSGAIGDGGLGLLSAQGALSGISPEHAAALERRYRLPEPRLGLRPVLRAFASAAADISDGLLADAGHIGEASGLGLQVDLDRLPISPAAATWLGAQPEEAVARLALATAGDDYEIVCTAPSDRVATMMQAASAAGVALSPVGRVIEQPGLLVLHDGEPVEVSRTGWRHR